jgi:hypothetical protein
MLFEVERRRKGGRNGVHGVVASGVLLSRRKFSSHRKVNGIASPVAVM